MNMSKPVCARCGSPLAEGALDGQCAHCLGTLAFGKGGEFIGEAETGAGDYEFLRELGRGGMGVVYEARQTGLNRRVAVKMLLAGVWAGSGSKSRFQAEAAAAARLHHPNIVTVHEVGVLEGQPFLVMDLIEGPSLADLSREKPLSAKRAARYVRIVAEAMAHAHDAGVLHRDLKPSNVLVDATDAPHITDFGVAKLLGDSRELTRTGDIVGSPNYLSPEQVSGGKPGLAATSIRSERYSTNS